jgi:hypothetical protein
MATWRRWSVSSGRNHDIGYTPARGGHRASRVGRGQACGWATVSAHCSRHPKVLCAAGGPTVSVRSPAPPRRHTADLSFRTPPAVAARLGSHVRTEPGYRAVCERMRRPRRSDAGGHATRCARNRRPTTDCRCRGNDRSVTLHAIRSRRVLPAEAPGRRDASTVTRMRQEAQMPAGSVSSVAEPHSAGPLGLPSLDQPTLSRVADGLPTGASMAGTGVDCVRCGGRGGVYIPTLLRELSCPECG